ncbi:hypothetical protein TCAL_05294 [Tigriopus californicus]|uniref:Chorein N-terminal domain-containing protein n=2 Tax=Tigriopus californicus TaxID=6832 RepID=A0A553P1S6_TIGCA|nr:hypothetical protein TCAL_05294 [Tigriopus californicus]|eukprot:TCALIF_05294-PA protein Name:"Similar to VPS13B Vacuolar protein sorting-associated protein 13B (Homo sapiens)" AED:0.01 eAED:0.00 QI:158/1/0.8/1/0.75/0.6/5/3378/2841
MFKLESYITPIILSYVEKYVKNIRAEHSQVSLWGGDVSFSNLDLRLDVLEQELHLPFSFVSGHIHELQIHVPWTRLHAEPIVITINTIECVLKLPGDDEFSGDSVDSSSVGSTGEGPAGTVSKRSRKRPKKPETPEAPPGYVQSLINKIISNVSIVCNNLILKYVEEDIVLSLNTRNLRLSSANELWERAFTELSLPDLILRKLLQVTDLTICLDKRNASGKIETYQEPLLYRCSFMVHAAWCYDSINSKIPRVSRYEIKCPKLDFSLTDTQIPMFMRILRLMFALYYGEIAQRNRKRIEHELEDDTDMPEVLEDGGGGDSWTGWAWNVGSSMGSALLPIYWDDEELDLDVPPLDAKRDKVLHMGVFIDHASLVFKLTEQQPEKSPFGSAKQIFTPFARLDCSGMFQEVIVKGVALVNVSLGVSESLFSPVGECLCGRIDTKSNNEPEIPFIKSGESGHRRHLRGSLFEKDFGNENGPAPKERRRSYSIDWDSHLMELSEDKMLERTASLAMDYLYYMDIPEAMTSEELSEVGLDLEHSNMSERALCRVVIGPIKVGLCSGLLHRMEIIQHLASNYDYPPYVLPVRNNDPESFPMPRKDEVDQLIQGTPFRVYQIMAINPVIHLYVSDHPKLVRFKKNGLGIRTSNFEKLPCLTTKLDSLDAQLSTPMYPGRLIRVVVPLSSQLSSTLVQSCYTNMIAKVTGLTSLLCLEDQFTTVFQGSLFQCSWKKLLRPNQWSEVTRILSDLQLDVSSLKFRLTHPQVKAIMGIINSQLDNHPKSMKLSDSSLMEDALTKRMSSLVFTTTGIHGQYCETKTVRYVHCVVENMGISLTEMGPDALKQIPILTRLSPSHPVMTNLQRSPMKMSPGRAQTKSMTGGKVAFESDSSGEPLLSFHAQVPLTDDLSACPSLILGHICQFDICLDPKLMDWLIYVPSVKFGLTPKGPSVKTRSDPMASDVNLTRSFSGRTGTSDRKTGLSTSHKRSKPLSGLSALSRTICHWFPTLNSMLIQIRAEGHHIYLPQKSIADFSNKTVQESVHWATKSDPTFAILCIALPSINLENVTHKPMIQQFLNSLPIIIPESVWNTKRDNLPWTLKLSEFSISTTGLNQSAEFDFILEPVSTSCTLGLSLKKSSPSEENVGFAIHTDMSPIQAHIRDHQLLFLVSLCDDILGCFAKMYPSLLLPTPSNNSECGSATDALPLSSHDGSTNTTATSMPRPPMESWSETTSTAQLFQDTVEAFKDQPLGPFSLWIQWTVPGISVKVSAVDQGLPVRLQLDMEDCQASFDWTKIYFKMKGRVQAVGIRHFVRKSTHTWRPGENHGIVVSCSDDITHDLHFSNSKSNNVEQLPHARHFGSEATFFCFTFTRAESSNIRKKWNQLMRKKTPVSSLPLDELDQTERFVSEIDIKVAPFDIVLAPTVVLPFIKLFSHILQLKILQIPNVNLDPAERAPRNKMIGMSINNNTSPMAYLQTQTIRVFLLSDSNAYLVAHQPALKPNFVLFTLDSISVSPQVDNPLTRIMVRPDLYQMALPVLNLPGAHIEDRQYSIDLGGLGIFTGDWTDVLEKSERPVKPVLKTMGENPALEWNTTKELSDQIDQKEVLLLPCLSKFDLKITAAPAIVLHSRKNGRDNYKLVAGHSLEVNATSEVAFYLSLAQIELLSSLSLEAVRTMMLVSAKFDLSKVRKIDSGIDCDASSQSKVQPESSMEVPPVVKEAKLLRFVPFETLITGSKITFSLFRLNEEQRGATQKDRQMWRKYRYKQRRMEILRERGQLTEESDLASEDENETATPPDLDVKKTLHDYDASEEESLVETKKEVIKLYPLAQMGVSQPHIFTSCSSNQQKLDVSIYDAYVNLAPPDYFITCGGRKLPEVKDFPIHWVQTKPGDVDRKSGVPPPLFAFSTSNFITLPIEIKAKVERPLKFALGLDLLNQFRGLWNDVNKAFHVKELLSMFSDQSRSEPFRQSPNTINPPDSLAQARHSLSSLSSVSISTKQIVLHFPVSEKGALISTEVIIGLMGIQASALLRSKLSKGQQIVDFVDSKLRVEQFLTRISYCGTSHQFTGPWTVNMKMSSIWLPHDPIPNITFKMDSDLFEIHVGPSHILAMDVIRQYVEDFPFGTKPSVGPLNLEHDEVVIQPVPKNEEAQLEQSYVDDLRAGAFQYVTNESSEDPKPYQVVFQRKAISAMTWRYPQPRTLTRVSVFPVPFMSASESGRHSNQEDEIVCALQYWDGCLGSFLTYSTFKLSEFDVSHLSLPTTKDRQRCAFSDMWRVVLDYDPDQQDYDNLDREVIVTPKSLVSVMRVDSYFNPNMIPRIQGSFHLPSVVLNLSNHLHFQGQKLARQYGNYLLKESHPMDQPVATLRLDSSLLGVDIWAKGFKCSDISVNSRLKTTPSVTVIDYAYLGSHYILLPTKIQVQANWNRNEKADELNLGINSKPLALRYGHFAHHTIQKTMFVWNQVLNREGDAELDPTILRQDRVFSLTHYLVCNNTQVPIRFGQVNTEENHLLLPQNAFMYAWRSPKASLKLRVCVEGGLWQWCEAFPLSHPKTFVANIDNGEQTTSLVVSIRNITTTEKQIVIQGLLSAARLLKDHLELKVIPLEPKANEGTKSSETLSHVEQRAIVGSFSSAPSFLLNPDQVQGIKIRLLGIGTPWSGEIPLQINRGRNNSVLVRIPTKEKGACLTVWCRVAQEVHNEMRRCLLLFSPMYMARSLLPNPMNILITLPGQSQPPTVMEILGRDVPVQLETSKPSDQKYNLSFKVVESLPASNPVPMSWGMIEQVRHGKPEPFVDIDEIIQSVPKLGSQHLDTEWPFINDPDMKLPLLDWDINEQPKTEVQVNFAPLHPLCNTL